MGDTQCYRKEVMSTYIVFCPNSDEPEIYVEAEELSGITPPYCGCGTRLEISLLPDPGGEVDEF